MKKKRKKRKEKIKKKRKTRIEGIFDIAVLNTFC